MRSTNIHRVDHHLFTCWWYSSEPDRSPCLPGADILTGKVGKTGPRSDVTSVLAECEGCCWGLPPCAVMACSHGCLHSRLGNLEVRDYSYSFLYPQNIARAWSRFDNQKIFSDWVNRRETSVKAVFSPRASDRDSAAIIWLKSYTAAVNRGFSFTCTGPCLWLQHLPVPFFSVASLGRDNSPPVVNGFIFLINFQKLILCQHQLELADVCGWVVLLWRS